MNRPILVLLVAVALAAPGCSAQRMRLADRAALDGNLESSFRLVRGVARRGNPEAQQRLGLMYREGRGVPANDVEAARWLRKATSQGLATAGPLLGQLYVEGKGLPEVDPEAEARMLEAADNGTSDVCYKLALRYLDGELVPQSDEEALRWLRRAVETRVGDEGLVDGRLLADGLLDRVAELGLAQAQFRLGEIYAAGNERPKSQAEAAKWYYLAAAHDHPEAMVKMGWIYGQGTGVPADYRESVRWFTKGSELNNAEAQYQLGLLYMRGVGVPLDEIEAHKWFNLAAANGHWRARQKRDTLAKRFSPRQLTQAERLAIDWKPPAEE